MKYRMISEDALARLISARTNLDAMYDAGLEDWLSLDDHMFTDENSFNVRLEVDDYMEIK